jgi:hypothetical protein
LEDAAYRLGAFRQHLEGASDPVEPQPIW